MNKDLCIVLTPRMASTRLPGKAIADVAGKPLLYWIIRRLQTIGNVILSVVPGIEDESLIVLGKASGIPVDTWPVGDVVGAINHAVNTYHPTAKYVLRGLGDMPFMAGEITARMLRIINLQQTDVFVWALAPNIWPVYGSRESPYSRAGLELIVRNSTVREHFDNYFHTHRERFKVSYHVAPTNIYFRPYRLEVDWPEDLALVRSIADKMSMLAPLPDIINFLDSNNTIARLNQQRVERTGPSCYSYAEQRAWMHNMTDQPILDWDGYIWQTADGHGQPVFCRSGQCLLGIAQNGILFARSGRFRGSAYLNCDCGSGLLFKGAS